MRAMYISLPEGLKEFVDTPVGPRGFGTSSEYVRELIRKGRDRQQLRGPLLAGAQSAPTAPVNAAYFDGLRKSITSKKTK